MNRDLAWPVVVIVAVVVFVVGGLIALDKPVEALLALVVAVVVPVLSALTIGELRAVKNNTNGMSTRMQDANDRLVTLLADELKQRRPGADPSREVTDAPGADPSGDDRSDAVSE